MRLSRNYGPTILETESQQADPGLALATTWTLDPGGLDPGTWRGGWRGPQSSQLAKKPLPPIFTFSRPSQNICSLGYSRHCDRAT